MSNKEIQSFFNFLQRNESLLNQSQITFLQSLRKYFKQNKRLSDKQVMILSEIAKYIQKQGVPVAEKTLF